jgi:glycerate kinase
MRVLIAFDKFKDALSAERACAVAAETLRAAHPDWEVDECPFTDGGDGFARILTAAAGGEIVDVNVLGPRGCQVSAPVGLVRAGDLLPATLARLRLPASPSKAPRIGVIDLASASGLGLLAYPERDPWLTSSIGTGQLIREAQRRGCTAILLGVGGSATNDLGLGALAALGLELLDANGAVIPVPTPARWHRIYRLRGKMPPDLPAIRIACDVTNPLLGPEGCTASFGPQKGLCPEDLVRMEAAAARMADRLCDHFGQPSTLADAPGSGAAGGIAFGLRAATGALLLPGADLVAEWLKLEERISRSDIVFTGEGRFDSGSLRGKGPGAIVAKAIQAGRKTHVFAGAIAGRNYTTTARLHAITPPDLPLADALPRTAELLRAAVIREFAGGHR